LAGQKQHGLAQALAPITGTTHPANRTRTGGLPRLGEPYLADCNTFRFAATALNLMRNVLICSSRACCSAPGGSLRAVSKSLAAIFSRSCILSPHCISLCRTQQIWGSVVCSVSDSTPKASSAGAERPVHGSPQRPDSPAAFLESLEGTSAIRVCDQERAGRT
jgi:hypothetical protein